MNKSLGYQPGSYEQIQLSLYNYYSNTVGDTVGDTRDGNISGWMQKETCTVVNAAKGGGTWIVSEAKKTISLTDSNEAEGAGTYIDLVASKSGMGELIAGDGTVYAKFTFTTAGVVTLWQNTDNVFTSLQTGTNHIIIKDQGSNVRITNEMGATLIFNVKVNYNV